MFALSPVISRQGNQSRFYSSSAFW